MAGPDDVQYLEYVPVVLDWTTYNWIRLDSNERKRQNSYMFNTSYGAIYFICRSGYEGDPYLPTGCEGKLQIQIALFSFRHMTSGVSCCIFVIIYSDIEVSL